ncbi:TetR/AcrR family transcriptional regulator [Dietzia lutea]|uniref:HTH tetR-type domain-containing protein n=1 Tax=Dietzia lutea TaxID=546160 RepID=A0A2S1RAJ7_9ACTN|nr:TetR/AcrR family transcriptional regulator [Dietzia lutea]AWH93251.1 hypothetical protein A6035_14870 [Dietzia lutea]
MGIRDEHRARMYREIQRAALDLVERKGLHATTVADIAARVGVSERTVFRYYSTKLHALLPGQQGLVDALVAGGGLDTEAADTGAAGTDAAGALAELTDATREVFAREIERSDFRRVSRLMVREPELVQAVAAQERDLVTALSAALAGRGTVGRLQALVVAEVVITTWRVAWQAFAREELEGGAGDPLALFDATVRELRGLFTG